jgi:hypothetical protein
MRARGPTSKTLPPFIAYGALIASAVAGSLYPGVGIRLVVIRKYHCLIRCLDDIILIPRVFDILVFFL